MAQDMKHCGHAGLVQGGGPSEVEGMQYLSLQ